MASPPPPVYLQTLDERGWGIQVEFHWRGDRYSHTIGAVDGDKIVPLLASMEETESDLFPSSPCLSQVHQQDQILFFTGATSACHWSMSVQATEPLGLVFEVACRLKSQPCWLGSTYKLLHPEAKEKFCVDSNLWSCETTEEDAEQIRIGSVADLPGEFPATQQWNYVVRA